MESLQPDQAQQTIIYLSETSADRKLFVNCLLLHLFSKIANNPSIQLISLFWIHASSIVFGQRAMLPNFSHSGNAQKTLNKSSGTRQFNYILNIMC